MTATRGAVGEWEYPPVVAAMDAVGLHPIPKTSMRFSEETLDRWQRTSKAKYLEIFKFHAHYFLTTAEFL